MGSLNSVRIHQIFIILLPWGYSFFLQTQILNLKPAILLYILNKLNIWIFVYWTSVVNDATWWLSYILINKFLNCSIMQKTLISGIIVCTHLWAHLFSEGFCYTMSYSLWSFLYLSQLFMINLLAFITMDF